MGTGPHPGAGTRGRHRASWWLGLDEWGLYPDGTRDVVKKSEKENSFKATGEVDCKTWAELCSAQGC